MATAPPTHPVTVDPFIFHGTKIGLRPVTLADCTDTYVAWLNDERVNRFLETRHKVQTLESVIDFVTRNNDLKENHLLAIIENSTMKHIGNLKIGQINHYHQSSTISYFIGDRLCWGKGYATEAIKGASQYCFNKLKLYTIQAGVYAKNIASIKALKRCGYKERGVLLNALCTIGEARDNHVILTLTLPEFKSMLT